MVFEARRDRYHIEMWQLEDDALKYGMFLDADGSKIPVCGMEDGG